MKIAAAASAMIQRYSEKISSRAYMAANKTKARIMGFIRDLRTDALPSTEADRLRNFPIILSESLRKSNSSTRFFRRMFKRFSIFRY